MADIFYIWSPLAALVAQGILAGVVLGVKRKNRSHYIFGVFVTLMALWALLIFGFRQSPNAGAALAWERAILPIFPLIAFSFLHFAMAVRGVRLRAAGPLTLLVVALFVLAPTPLVLKDVVARSYGWAPATGPLFAPWLLLVYSLLFIAFYTIWRTYREGISTNERNRSLYILAGQTAALAGGLTDYLAAAEVFPYPLGIIGNLLFALIVSVAILRHRLLELQFYLRRSLAYGLASGILALAFAVALLLAQRVSEWGDPFSNAIGIGLLVVLAIAAQPLFRRFQDMTDRWAFRSRYEGLRALRQFSQEAGRIIDLERLCQSLLEVTGRALETRVAHVLVYERDSGNLVLFKSTTLDPGRTSPFSPGSPLLMLLEGKEDVLEGSATAFDPRFQGLPESRRAALERLQGELFIPMRADERPVGLLVLGARAGGPSYTIEETNLIIGVAAHAALAIENARLYSLEQRQVAELAKLDQAKTDFFLTAAHHLKTPLTTLRLGVDMLQERVWGRLDPQEQQLLAAARRSLDTLQHEISHLLEFLRIKTMGVPLKLEAADMRQLIAQSVEQVAALAKSKHHSLEVEVEPGLPAVPADAEAVENVLVNLLDNACKFTPPGGRITVQARRTDQAVTVYVRDSGPGIPQKMRASLFDGYYQVRDSAAASSSGSLPGSGLGLAICKSLIEAHGGHIWVGDQPEGACLAFALPLEPHPAAARLEPPRAATTRPRG